MKDAAADLTGSPQPDADPAAIVAPDRAPWERTSPRMGAPEPADARTRCIATAAAIHSYLMAQRLPRMVP